MGPMLTDHATRTFHLQAKLFRGFADPSRLSIIEALRSGPLHVGAIVELTGLSQPNVSNHLRCLSECGLVQAEQRGRFVDYRLGDERIAEVLQLADEFLASTVCGVDDCKSYSDPSAPACTAKGDITDNQVPAEIFSTDRS